jgi:L-lactate dehydrogenase (cytochrome)
MTQTINPGNPEGTHHARGHCAPPLSPCSGRAPRRRCPAALKRRVPKYSDLAPLIQVKKPEFNRAARLRRASTIWELREIAKRRTPRAPFDYTDGAVEAEITLRRARQAFLDIEFRPVIVRRG